MKIHYLFAFIVANSLFTGCSGAFWGGTGAGVAGTGAAYEIRSAQQMRQIEEDYKAGKIDQKEYEIRRDQVRRGSIVQ